jgi:putative Mg2+ transporter-C (MgtC) family protein
MGGRRESRDRRVIVPDWFALINLLIAYALALPVGWEREKHERSAGLRTFPLIAVASCGFVLAAEHAFRNANAEARVIEGLIAGVGFVGGGTILKGRRTVHGTATASSILVTGAIGMAVAYRLYDVALLLSALSFITLRLFPLLKRERTPRENRDEGGRVRP